jgi:AAA15 family ATPase/GTPase
MLQSIEISDFRVFRDVKIRRLQKLNLITGKNGGGKTTLLEALFLLAGAANATLGVSLATFRGDNLFNAEVDNNLRSIFRNLNVSTPIRITGVEEIQKRRRNRALIIDPITRARQVAGRSAPENLVSGLRFRFIGSSAPKELISTITWAFDRLVIPGSGSSSLVPQQTSSIVPQQPVSPFQIEVPPENDKAFIWAQFLSPYISDFTQEIYDQLKAITLTKRVDRVIEFVKIVNRSVVNVTPIDESGIKTIYVDTGSDRLLPMSAVGSGFSHLLRLALAMESAGHGMLIIDELEDGIHYSVFEDLAHAIISYIVDRNVQVFIATHSMELLRAFISRAAKDNFQDISLHNCHPNQNEVTVNSFESEELSDALEFAAELR